MATNLKFSILIPTTGRSELIGMSIKSVLDQTYKNFEIIIGDSSPEQATRSIAEGFQDERIKYLPVSNSHPFFTFDHPAKAATGDYLLWLDDDNYLLPFALELFNRAAEKSRAEIITASHVYYYDNRHPRHYLRNSLGIVPFTGGERSLDLKQVIRDLYLFKRSGVGPRFHTSATIFSRQVAKRAIDRLGFVLITDMPNVHSHQPILFSFAKTGFYVDYPVVIVGRFGVSMSQSWSTAARKRFQKLSFKPIYSPLIGYTRINGIAENYLRVKRLLPDLLGGVDLDYFKFAEIYLKELLYLDTDIATAINNWENFLAFVKKMPPPERQRLLSKTRRFIWLAPIIYLSRRLRLHQLWRALYGWLIDWRRKQDPAPVAAKIRDKKEFEISVAKYGVNSIDSLADELRPILLKEAGLDLYCF